MIKLSMEKNKSCKYKILYNFLLLIDVDEYQIVNAYKVLKII